MKTTSRLLGLCLSLSMLFALPACSGGQSASSAPAETTPAPTESSAAEESHYPVTVTTYNQNGEEAEQTFTKCPERVVSISQANTEMLVSLGLSDLIVATAHRTSTPWPETAAEYESLNFLAMDDYPSKEVVLSLEPDLIVGWGSLFADDALGATSDWNDRGINTYLMKNTVSGLGKRNFEFLIQDIENFGPIHPPGIHQGRSHNQFLLRSPDMGFSSLSAWRENGCRISYIHNIRTLWCRLVHST